MGAQAGCRSHATKIQLAANRTAHDGKHALGWSFYANDNVRLRAPCEKQVFRSASSDKCQGWKEFGSLIHTHLEAA